jgi:tRNA (guanine37-N1)-methyltransferase
VRIDVLTLFPGMFAGPFDESIVARARAAGIVDVRIHDLRAWTADRHRTVDDYPYGGGAGMVLKPEPLFAAIESLRAGAAGAAGAPPADAAESAAEGEGKSASAAESASEAEGAHVVLLTPQGEVFRQAVAADLASRRHLVLVCGHYEGVDERVREHAVDREVSGGFGRRRVPQRRPAGVPPVHPPGRVPRLARPGRAALRPPRRHRPLAARAGGRPHPGPAARSAGGSGCYTCG